MEGVRMMEHRPRTMDVVVTAKCYEDDCGGTMEGRKGKYQYIESGLKSVELKDIMVFHCTKCNAIVPEIPAAGLLHRIIALRLLCKKTLLTGSELRFLRKLCGYSINEFSEIMGSSKDVVSRWENHDKAGKGTDRTVRLLVMGKLIREIAGQPDPMLKNVTVEQLIKDVEQALKLIEARRTNQKYEIPPEEIARLGGREDSRRAWTRADALSFCH
jgi:transcriptional regulator with XRE-family HTH domain